MQKIVHSIPHRLTSVVRQPMHFMQLIFDTCISPILLYGSEACCTFLDNDYKKWELSPIEKVHTQFLKRMLGVNYSTTNILLRRECGRNPLQENIPNRSINYLKYITNKNNNTLVKQALD